MRIGELFIGICILILAWSLETSLMEECEEDDTTTSYAKEGDRAF